MARPATTRLFLALWPDPAIREALRAWRDAWTWPVGAVPVSTDKLHMTLHFLGNQPSVRVPELVAGLAVPLAPFRLELGVPKAWPGGIAVLEPFHVPGALLQLHAGLSTALLSLGLSLEPRAYRPHVTMARRAGQATLPAQAPPLAWDISGYALVASRLGGYDVLARYG
ncbi:RNA 2',3'-cyclic phosphodiesterase [Massilia solisilvae]|uniref:RNA 2',3'-cyclic phosphodiesterase n=1 Tax=Massilia solisilvae TaxID=1811225 RepID=A0ABT2BLK5_9BURK|nr:RNA 2',3'-cyclic phosphodiesterase [Massilia solisilvae]MCS0609286.1 RNA 2',3'-cyclic phosphodiesterase [Massilia solisilvae]